MALPGISSRWIDGQLSQPTQDTSGRRSVLVIGSSADGPLYEPVAVQSIADAKAVFGSFNRGTLVRGIEEVFLSAASPINVRGMRLGGGKNARVEVKESDGATSSLKEEQETGYALLMEALQPGNIYNGISIGYRNGKTIEIFNPKTGFVSGFSYDSNRNNTAADVHTVSELVDAINADPNLNSVLIASFQELGAHFEITAKGGNVDDADDPAASGIFVDPAGRTHITLGDRTPFWDVYADGGIVNPRLLDNMPASGSVTAGNNIERLLSVYSIADIGENERLVIAGRDQGILKNVPLDMGNVSGKNTLTALKDYDNDGDFWVTPSGSNAVTEIRQVVDRLFVGTGDGSTLQFKWNAAQVIDDGDVSNDVTSLVRGAIAVGNNVITLATTGYDDAGAPDQDALTTVLIEKDGRARDWNNQVVTSSGTFQLFWDTSNIGRPVSEYSLSWDGATATVTEFGSPRATVTFTTAPPSDVDLFVTYKTIPHTMPENSTRAAATTTSNAWDSWRRYFVAHNVVHLGGAAPTDLEVRYAKVVYYEAGTQVELVPDPPSRVGTTTSSDTYSTIRFNDPGNQPGPGASGLVSDQNTRIGFEYVYLPEFPDLTSFKNMSGGTDGTDLNNLKLFDELETAYQVIENYPVDIIVPMGATIDATKQLADPETGLMQTVNAGFHTQLADVLELMTENVDETLGVIGVEPPRFNTRSVVSNTAELNDWVRRLTQIVPGDLLRTANIMAGFGSRLMSIVAFEPVFFNEIEGIPGYTANGAAMYAGIVSSLPPAAAPTNKILRGVTNLRYHLSRAQLEALNDARYVTAQRARNARGQFVITDGITAAPVGSDYTRLTTVRIVIRAMDIVRAVCDPYIGRGLTPGVKMAMETSITSGLKAMMDAGELIGFDFALIATPEMVVKNFIDVELVLTPAFELRRVRAIVRLRKPAQ